jgi:hypothetical protein
LSSYRLSRTILQIGHILSEIIPHAIA